MLTLQKVCVTVESIGWTEWRHQATRGRSKLVSSRALEWLARPCVQPTAWFFIVTQVIKTRFGIQYVCWATSWLLIYAEINNYLWF